MAPTATPIPIPAFAPADRLLVDVADGVEVEETDVESDDAEDVE